MSDSSVEITFQGMDKSDALEANIAERVARLERHFSRMTHCRVVVAAPHRHSHKGKTYQIKIEIGIPGQAPVVVASEPEINRAHEDILVAIRDAFDAAKRRLDDVATRLNAGAKQERGRRRPSPVRS